jgi:RNase P protein component
MDHQSTAASDNLQSHLKQLEQVNEELRLYSFSSSSETTTSTSSSSSKSSANNNNSSKNSLNLTCHVNSTPFKFNLIVSSNDCVGDLKAIVREIIARVIRSARIAMNASQQQEQQEQEIVFICPPPFTSSTATSKFVFIFCILFFSLI